MGDLKNLLDKTIAASQTKSEKTLTALTDSSTKLKNDLQSDFSLETIQIIQDTVRNSDTASLDDLTTRIARLRELQRYVAVSEVGATESTILKTMIDTSLKTLTNQVRVKKDLLTKVRGAIKSHAVNAGALMVAMSGRDPLVALGVKLAGDKLMDWRRRKKEVTADRKYELAEDAKQLQETQQQSDPNIDDDISPPPHPQRLRKKITIHRDSNFSNTQPTDIASISPFKNVLEDLAMFAEENTSILLNIKELVAANSNIMAEMDFMQPSRSMEDALRPTLHEPELIRYESSDSSTPGNMFKPILEDMSMFTEESTGVLIQIRDLMTTEFHERAKSRAELRRKGFSDIELEIEAERKREKSVKRKKAETIKERLQREISSSLSGAKGAVKGAVVDATSVMSGVIGGNLINKLLSRLSFRVPILGILKGTLGITGAILAPALNGIYGYLKHQSRGGTGFGGFVGGILGGPQFKSKLLNVAANMGSYAVIGAKLGSVVPGIGTALGAVVGGIVGGLMAYLGPRKIANYVEDVGVWAFDQMAAMFNRFVNGISVIRNFFEKGFDEGYVLLLKAQRSTSFSKARRYRLSREIEALENAPQPSINNLLPTDARTFSEVRRDNANLRAEGNTFDSTNRIEKQPRKSGKGEKGVLSRLNEKYEKYRSQESSEQGRLDPKTMKVSKAGIEFIKKHEGFKSTPYWDVNGWAIGYGSHRMPDGRPVQPGDRISRPEADKQLREWVNAEYTSNIRRVIKRPLAQNEFDALASISWNAGGGSFKESSRVVRAINEGDFEKAGGEIKRHYATVEGKHHPVISQRREEESAMFLSSLQKPEQRADLTTTQPDTKWKQLTAPPSGLPTPQPTVNVVNQSSVATSRGPSGAMDHTVGGTDSRLSSVMYYS